MFFVKTVAIVQSNYIPWKGYFDLINLVDEFILYDDVQFTRRDWRNRNKVKTPQGATWLTIPVQSKGKYKQAINETMIDDPRWNEKHWKTLQYNYGAASYFKEYKQVIEELYEAAVFERLSDVNFHFLQAICNLLGIGTEITWSMDYENDRDDKTERLVTLSRQAGAEHYISGPAAKDYLDESLFENAGIRVSYMDYSDYLEYEQLFPPFEPNVSILDLIFNTGPDAKKYMKSF